MKTAHAATSHWSKVLGDPYRIMCFGDSLTWGWAPVESVVPSSRYAYEERWTGLLADKLGDGFVVIEEGLNGRTTNVDDPVEPRQNASRYLPTALASQFPLDLVIVLLGTNDLKTQYNRSAFDVAVGVSQLLGQIKSSAGGIGTLYPAPKILLLAPPPLGEMSTDWSRMAFAGAQEKSRELAEHYKALAAFFNISFLDLGDVVRTDGVDGIHFSVQNNIDVAAAVYEKVVEIVDG